MKKHISSVLLSLVLCFSVFGSLAGASGTPTSKAATGTDSKAKAPLGELRADQFMFGYTDSSGKQILGLTGDPEKKVPAPKTLVSVLYAPGKQFSVSYVKHQKGSDQSDGRQNAVNFQKDEGELFKLTAAGKLTSDSSVLLATRNAFQRHTMLTLQSAQKGKFSQKTIKAIEKAKKRKVASQSLIAATPSGTQIGIVRFVQGGDKPLASLVLADQGGMVFEDFVGSKDPMSTWRVDDGGEISAEQFHLLFASYSQAGYALAYEWYGTEGTNLSLVQQKGMKFRVIQEAGRYQSPY